MKQLFLCAVMLTQASALAWGQGDGPPRVATSASAEVTVPADKARFTVGAVVRADKARDAGARVSALVNAVRDALVKLGLDRNALPSAGYSVSLEQTDGTRQPRVYTASSLVSVELTNLDQLGAVVDAALAAGATEVSPIQFLPKDADAARGRALELAVSQARADAEAIARAAGGRLGALIMVSSDRASPMPFEAVSLAARSAGTSIPAPEVRISAFVQAQWQFTRGGAAR